MSIVVRLTRVLGVVFVLSSVLPAVALAADPIASTTDVVATGASTATVDASIDPGGLSTTYQVGYGLATSSWCTSGGVAGSPPSSTAARTLGFTDSASHNVTISLSGLTPATTYCVDLIATNSSATVDGGQISLTAGVPSASTTDAIATGASTATVDGSVNPSGQTTTYKVEYDLASSTWCTSGEASGSPANSTAPQTLGFADSSWHNASTSLSGLTPGASYCVDLVATDSSGVSDGGQVSLAPGSPGAYTVDAIATGAGAATVDASIDPIAQSTTYQVEYDLASSLWCTSGEASGSPAHATGTQTLSFTDTSWHAVAISLSGLTAGASYCVDLVATNPSGASDGGQISLGAAVPSSQTTDAIATGAGTATVDGSVDPLGQSTTYAVEYDLASSTWCTSGAWSGSAASSTAPQTLGFTDTVSHAVSIPLSGLAAGATYCVDLVAMNASGSGDGGQISLTTIGGPAPPAVVTGSATGVSQTGATIAGTVNPNGLATIYQFQYGTTTSYGSTTTSASAGSGSSAVNESATLTGLTARTTYHYRLIATSTAGTTTGADQTFTTATAAVAPTPPLTPTPPTAPAEPTAPKTSATPTAPRTPTTPTVSRVRMTVTSLNLHLSEPATVIVAISATGTSHACVNTSKKNGNRCARSASRTSLTLHGVAGANTFRLRVPTLAPGRYRAAVVARGADGLASRPVTVAITIPKPKPKPKK
jgi:hypothetical protein